jgi:hypothetical protein
MYHHEFPITVSQRAADGALSLFVEGFRQGNVPQMLFGLKVLQSATAAQVEAAMPSVELSQRVTRAEISAMFAR